MASEKGSAKQPFNRAVQLQIDEQEKGEASKTATQEQPIPRPKPPSIGRIVDETIFRERWHKQMPPEKVQDSTLEKPLSLKDAFDRVDHSHRRQKGQERD